ncbi:MAG: glycosyltransferase [Bacteroidetes bacterium]|jgi:glycosyltransferase involved in cell wall biosynthesis|nr:glycosyltransferase [Bacteroidota bacterium]
MRVAYIMMRFPLPSETFAVRDVKALRALGVDVDVYTLRAPHPAASRLTGARDIAAVPVTHGTPMQAVRGMKVGLQHPRVATDLLRWIAHGNRHRLAHLFNGYWFSAVALSIWNTLRRDPPDVVHLFWGHYPALVGYLVEHYLPDVPLSMFLGAYDLGQQFGGTAPVLARADAVWTHAATNVAPIAALGGRAPEEVQVVPRGLALDIIDAALVRHGRDPLRLVATGRLIPEKGMDDVLRCMAAVRETHPGVRLTVLGQGPAREALGHQADTLGLGEAVTFLGHVSEGRVAAELAQSTAFLLLSRKPTERLPNAVKEAMAAGCVAITTQTPGIEELVTDGSTGYVVPQGAPDIAAARVAQVLERPAAHSPMRIAARRAIEERFEVTACMRQYKAGWEALLSQTGP